MTNVLKKSETITALIFFLLDRGLKSVALRENFSYTYEGWGWSPFLNDQFFLWQVPLIFWMGISFFVLMGLGIILWTSKNFTDRIVIAVMMAAIVSNALDRFLLNGVVDYFSLGSWSVVNFSDAAIIFGTLFLVGKYVATHEKISTTDRRF